MHVAKLESASDDHAKGTYSLAKNCLVLKLPPNSL